MSMNKQTKKRLILISAAIVVAVGLAMGIWFFIQYRIDHKTVEVLAVSDPSVTTTYWGHHILLRHSEERLPAGAVPL